jgi:hypothetical protein
VEIRNYTDVDVELGCAGADREITQTENSAGVNIVTGRVGIEGTGPQLLGLVDADNKPGIGGRVSLRSGDQKDGPKRGFLNLHLLPT